MEPKKRGKLIGSHEYLLGCAILICNSSMKQNWQQKRSLLNLYLLDLVATDNFSLHFN